MIKHHTHTHTFPLRCTKLIAIFECTLQLITGRRTHQTARVDAPWCLL